MPILGGLSILIQILFAIHAVKTGRDRTWLYFIIFVPLIGCAAYFFTQVLPDLGNDPKVRNAGRTLARSMNPLGELKRRKEELEISDNIDNRLALADECMAMEYFDEAETLYRSCQHSHHATDPDIYQKLAEAQFAQSRFAEAQQSLENLIAHNPDYQSTAGHLLYARTLAEMGDVDSAFTEYDALLPTYPGEEARVRYALLLERTGHTEKANRLFSEAITRTNRAPRYYRKKEKPWIDLARAR